MNGGTDHNGGTDNNTSVDDDFVLSDSGRAQKKKKAKKEKNDKDKDKESKNGKDKDMDPEARKQRKKERAKRRQEKRERKEQRRERRKKRKEKKRQRESASEGDHRDSAIDLTADSEKDQSMNGGTDHNGGTDNNTSVDEEGNRKKRKRRKRKKDKEKRSKKKEKEKKHRKKKDKHRKDRGSKHKQQDGVKRRVQMEVDATADAELQTNQHVVEELAVSHNHNDHVHHQYNGNAESLSVPVPALEARPQRNEVEVIDLVDSPTNSEDTDKKHDGAEHVIVPLEAAVPEVKMSEVQNVEAPKVKNPVKRRRRRRGRSKSSSKTNSPEATTGETIESVNGQEVDKKDSDENSCDVHNVQPAACSLIGDAINTLAIDQKQEERDEKGNPSDDDRAGENVASAATSTVIVLDSD